MSDRAAQQVDAIDQHIINELAEDARLPVATLAKRVNLSRNAVTQRLERLERSRVILGYTVRLGEDRRPGEHTIALILIFRKDRMRGAEVTTALRKYPEVRSCFVMSGSLDLVIQVETDQPDRVREICADIWEMPGVMDTQTTFVLQTVLDRR